MTGKIMTKALALGALLAFLASFSASSHAAATLRLAIPALPTSHGNNNPTQSLELSAAQIDAALGNNLFSSNANALFADLATLRSDLAIEVRDAFLANPDQIKQINFVTVETRPLSARLIQNPTSIGLDLTGIKITVDGKADGKDIPLFCTSVNFTAEITLRGTGNFSFSSLALDTLAFDPTVNILSASCSGVFGFLGNLIVSVLTSGLDSILGAEIEDQFRANAGFSSLPTAFSLADLTNGLVQAVPAGPVGDKVLDTVDHFLFLASQNFGLEFAVVLHPDIFGPGGNLIEMVASHQRPDVDAFDLGGTSGVSVQTVTPSNLCRLYVNYTLWTTATCSDFLFYPSSFPNHSKIMVVVENSFIPGLRSFPGLDHFEVNMNCDPGQVFCLP